MIKKLSVMSCLLLGTLDAAIVETNKNIYSENKDIIVSFYEMSGHEEDWVAIYSKGSSNDWDNVLQWDWTDGKDSGTLKFDELPKGSYEVRAFYRNSYNVEARKSFKVQDNAAPKPAVLSSPLLPLTCRACGRRA